MFEYRGYRLPKNHDYLKVEKYSNNKYWKNNEINLICDFKCPDIYVNSLIVVKIKDEYYKVYKSIRINLCINLSKLNSNLEYILIVIKGRFNWVYYLYSVFHK